MSKRSQRKLSDMMLHKKRKKLAHQKEQIQQLLKGEKGKNCNVTACQKPNAWWFNKATKKYYCRSCAHDINWPGGRAMTMKLFGTPYLCEYEGPSDEELHSETEIR